MRIGVKRVYDPPAADDGLRVLVDRLWPRGVTKQTAAIHLWAKALAPSAELRQWFGHAPERWPEFRRRYWAELDALAPVWQGLLNDRDGQKLTLLFAARDPTHNNAVALAEYLAVHSDNLAVPD